MVTTTTKTTLTTTTTTTTTVDQDDDDDDSDEEDVGAAAESLEQEEDRLMFGAVVHQIMMESIKRLKDSGVDEAEESVFQLLAQVLNLSYKTGFRELRHAYYSSSQQQQQQQQQQNNSLLWNRRLTKQEWNTWQSLLERRCQHEPIQYILGQWDFLDYTFSIQPPLLCPRPETEELVELISQSLLLSSSSNNNNNNNNDNNNNMIRVLDVGCGTGCIGIALAHRHRHVHVTALDIDPIAISVSQENAKRILGETDAALRYSAHLVAAAEFQPLQQQEQEQLFHVVVSNPPYIPPCEMTTLAPSVLHYESHRALCASSFSISTDDDNSNNNKDGMQMIREIVQALPKWCYSGARCWMEVHPTHPKLLQEWLSTTTTLSYSSSSKDEPVVATAAATTSERIILPPQPPLGVSFVQSVLDFQGKDRFVQLIVTTKENKAVPQQQQ